MEFQIGNLEMWRDKALEAANRQKREIIIRLFRSVIMDTPVDEGTLRANWRTGVEKPITDPVVSDAWQQAISSMQGAVSGSNLPDTLYLTNNLPYAAVIEYGLYPNPPKTEGGKTSGGFSKKAPHGMVRKNVMRFNRIAETVRMSR